MWHALATEGFLEQVRPRPVLSRSGILAVDSLLPRFFPPPEAPRALDGSGHRS